MTLRSAQFDDVYFSAEDGLAETRYVFLVNNNLPAAWRGRDNFTICETGFGTGLNFLAAWTAFAETAEPGQRLHFISVEKYPLSREQITAALERWEGAFGGRLPRLVVHYPLRVPGFHRIVFDTNVILTLIFDDVADALPQVEAPGGVDAWFLDGFAPKKNPEMWTDALYAQMARLSHEDTTFATFTAVSAVRSGLKAAGFAVERVDGFGSKWHMTRGRFAAGQARPATRPAPSRVGIIGGGLAGCAAAYSLRQRGISVTLFEKAETLAVGASGNAEGLYNPRLSAHRTAQSDYYGAALALAARIFPALGDIGWRPHGSLHLATNAERAKKFQGALSNWGWPAEHMRWCEAEEASVIAGVALSCSALWLPDAGAVSPVKLCAALVADVDVRLGADVTPVRDENGWRIGDERFEAVVVAAGSNLNTVIPAQAGIRQVSQERAFRSLPDPRLRGDDRMISLVRGQLTEITSTPATASLKTNLCFGGYLAPARESVHSLGASFQPWLDDPEPRDEDDAANVARLRAVMPNLGEPRVAGRRVSFRAASRDRLPIVGEWRQTLYLSAAHGSHGIISSLAAAELLADLLTGAPRSLPAATVMALSPGRKGLHR